MRRAVLATLACLSLACADRPDVVLVVIDTLRADHLPFYGYERDTAPFLGSLAEEGALFEHAFSASSSTAPATASIFTSLYPTQHGVRNGLRATRKMRAVDPTLELNRIPETLATLPERMKEAGYVTYGVSDNLNVGEPLGFTQGFDEFVLHSYKGAQRMNETLRGWHETLVDPEAPPYFLYVHYMDPHQPYRHRSPWYEAWADGAEGEDPTAAYDSEIRFTDAALEETFRLYGWERDTLLVVTADHGEEFGDHGGSGHGKNLWGELINVPLLVYAPGRVRPGRRATWVSTLDVLPTLVAAARGPRAEGLEGRSLWPLLEGDPPDAGRVAFAEAMKKSGGEPFYLKRAVLADGWKYVRFQPLARGAPDDELLFDLTRDAGERDNRIAAEPARAAALAAEIPKLEARARADDETVAVPMDDETRRHLEELGYVE